MSEKESIKNMSFHRVRELLGIIDEVDLTRSLPWDSRIVRYRSAQCQVCRGRGTTQYIKVVGRRCICPLCMDQISRKALATILSLRKKRKRRYRKSKALWTWGKALEVEEICIKDIGIEKYLLRFIE